MDQLELVYGRVWPGYNPSIIVEGKTRYGGSVDRTGKQAPYRIGLLQETAARNSGMIAQQSRSKLLGRE